MKINQPRAIAANLRSDLTYRHATLMPLRETVRMVVGSEEDIFDESFCYVVNSMDRVVKVRKDALEFGV